MGYWLELLKILEAFVGSRTVGISSSDNRECTVEVLAAMVKDLITKTRI
jgi:hypothetical protein